jgi:2-polyprenyl-3-methyl-5-hydroxy-6-metoxy-1,4-benzoquinol methylase
MNQELHNWQDKDVEAHWDRVAHLYVQENNKVKYAHDQRFRESIKHLDFKGGMKVLNITSRDAEADDYLHQEAKGLVINAEISFGLIKVAATLRPQATQVKIETYARLPFANGSFDRILSLETLEHVANPTAFLKELHRISKPETIMVLSCPPHSAEWPYRVFTTLFGGHGEGPHRFPRPTEVKKLLSFTGWRLLDHFGSVLIPVGPIWLQDFGEKVIKKYQETFIADLGIRQFYICQRAYS